MSSFQETRYLTLRSQGIDPTRAEREANLLPGESLLIEKAIERGDLIIPAAVATVVPEEEIDMAKQAKAGDQGDKSPVTNLTSVKELIKMVVPKIINLKNDRKSINEDIAALRESVNAAGVSKKALDMAIRAREMDPDDRAAFDEGYVIARESVGLGLQRGLFEMLDERQAAEDSSPPQQAPATAPKKRGRPPGSGKKANGAEAAAEEAPAAVVEDNADLGEPDWRVVDKDPPDSETPLYLMANKQDWDDDPAQAGVFSEVRAKQLAEEHAAEAEAVPVEAAA